MSATLSTTIDSAPTHGAYDPLHNVGKALIDAAALMTRAVDARARTHGLSVAQWIVLIRIGGGAARTASELCQILNQDSGAMKRMLDRLDHANLIERRPSPHDARAQTLVLTERGRDLYERLRPVAIDVLDEHLRDFSRQEVATLLNFLERIVAASPETAHPASALGGCFVPT